MIATLPQLERSEQRIVMRGVTWRQYDALVSEPVSRAVRIAFDQGVMELMSPSHIHEYSGSQIGRLIEVFTEIRDIDIWGSKSTTFRREDLERGFEADESYYIQHAEAVRGLMQIDLTCHPAPDLVIEIDISRSSLPKSSIYGALGVSEVWLYHGATLRVFTHQSADHYLEVRASQVLPDFPIADVPQWLSQMESLGETKTVRAFRAEQQLRIDLSPPSR